MALVDTLQKIDTLKQEWDSLQPISKEALQKLWQKLRLEWNYNSNHIEGNTLTYGETELLLIFDKTTGNHELREYEEMKAHDVAIQLIRDWAQDENHELTEADIRSLNEVILVRPYWKEALTYDGQSTRRQIKVGLYKEHPNSVRLKNGEIFHYASPDETPQLMYEMMEWYRENRNDLHPAVLAAVMHYKFVRIHPFDDGNGRIARLLLNYALMRAGYIPIVIKSIDKDNYLTALQMADVGNIEVFSEYIGQQVIVSLQLAIKAAKGESIEEEDDVDKRIEILRRQLKPRKGINISRTTTIVKKLFKDSIIPFLDAINQQVRIFDDFFMNIESTLSISISNNNKYLFFDMRKENVDSDINNMLQNAKDIHLAKFEIRFNSFKYSPKVRRDTTAVLTFDFLETTYNLFCDMLPQNEDKIIKLYDEHLTDNEQRVIIKAIKERTVQNIEEFSSLK